MSLDFALRGVLFFFAWLPVGLLIPLYLEAAYRILVRARGPDNSGLSNLRTKAIVLVTALILVSVVTYYWWGLLCWDFIMYPVLDVRSPTISLALVLTSWFGEVPVLRGYYSEMVEKGSLLRRTRTQPGSR